MRGRPQVSHTLEAKEALLRNISRETPFLSTHLGAATALMTSQKAAYTLTQSPKFCNGCPEYTSRSSSLEASRDYHCSPTGLHIFEYFKSCCLRIWFQSADSRCLMKLLLLDHSQILAEPLKSGHFKNESCGLDKHKG